MSWRYHQKSKLTSQAPYLSWTKVHGQYLPAAQKVEDRGSEATRIFICALVPPTMKVEWCGWG